MNVRTAVFSILLSLPLMSKYSSQHCTELSTASPYNSSFKRHVAPPLCVRSADKTHRVGSIFLNTLQATFLSKLSVCCQCAIYTLQAVSLLHSVRCNLLLHFNVVLNLLDRRIALQQEGKCRVSDSKAGLSKLLQ